MNAITDHSHLTAEGFFELCQANQDLQLERAATGESLSCPFPGQASKTLV